MTDLDGINMSRGAGSVALASAAESTESDYRGLVYYRLQAHVMRIAELSMELTAVEAAHGGVQLELFS